MKKIVLLDLQTLIVCFATGVIGGLGNITPWYLILFIFPLLFGWIPFHLLNKKMDEYLEKVTTVVVIDFLLSVTGLVLSAIFLDEKSFMGIPTAMALFMRIVAHIILISELQWRWDIRECDKKSL